MVSKKKVLRDLAILVIILIAVLTGWFYFSRQTVKKSGTSSPVDMMGKMPSNVEIDMKFDTDNDTGAIKIDDKVFTIGQIDSEAKKDFSMIKEGMGDSNQRIDRDKLRAIAIRMLVRDVILEKKASELGIQKSQKEIEDAFQKRAQEAGGMEQMNDLMKSVGTDRESMMRKIGKDLLVDSITKMMFPKLEVPKGEDPDNFRMMKFLEWLGEQAKKTKVESLVPEMETIVENLTKNTDESPGMPSH